VEPREYKTLKAYEDWYWWYRAERELLIDTVRRLGIRPGGALLDAGCGSGRNAETLCQQLGFMGFGVDVSEHAAALWNGERNVRRCLGSVNRLPYADNSFDIVVSVDVLECQQVDPSASFREMARVTREGGHVVVFAPAFSFLLSRHDVAVHSVRRFCRPDMQRLADSSGLAVRRMTYAFAAFFPAIAGIKLVRRINLPKSAAVARSDLEPLPRWLNRCLLSIARVEHRVTRHVDAPVGSTLVMIATKTG